MGLKEAAEEDCFSSMSFRLAIKLSPFTSSLLQLKCDAHNFISGDGGRYFRVNGQ